MDENEQYYPFERTPTTITFINENNAGSESLIQSEIGTVVNEEPKEQTTKDSLGSQQFAVYYFSSSKENNKLPKEDEDCDDKALEDDNSDKRINSGTIIQKSIHDAESKESRDRRIGPVNTCKCLTCLCNECPYLDQMESLELESKKESEIEEKATDLEKYLSLDLKNKLDIFAKVGEGDTHCDCSSPYCKECTKFGLIARFRSLPTFVCKCDVGGKTKEFTCKCNDCPCDPCKDASKSKKKEGDKKPDNCKCTTCTCKPCEPSDDKDKKDGAEKCKCSDCKCTPCSDPDKSKGSGGDKCKCTDCKCTPCSDPEKSKGSGSDKCKCSDCKCTPCSDSGKDSKGAEADKCKCTDCKCSPCSDPSKSKDKGADKCKCADCKCTPCSADSDKSKDKEADKCKCTDCKCAPCSDPDKSKGAKDCKCKCCKCSPCTHTKNGGDKGGESDACKCKECKCSPCSDPSKAKDGKSGECLCTTCACNDCKFKKGGGSEGEKCNCDKCSCPVCKKDGNKEKDKKPCKCETKCSCLEVLRNKGGGIGGTDPPTCNCNDCSCPSCKKTSDDFGAGTLECSCAKCTCPVCTRKPKGACRCKKPCKCDDCLLKEDDEKKCTCGDKCACESCVLRNRGGGVGGGADLPCSCKECSCPVCSKKSKGEKSGADLGCNCKECSCPVCSKKGKGGDKSKEKCNCKECACKPCALMEGKESKSGASKCECTTCTSPECKNKNQKDKDKDQLSCNCKTCSCPVCTRKDKGGQMGETTLECQCDKCSCPICSKMGDPDACKCKPCCCTDCPKMEKTSKKSCNCVNCNCAACVLRKRGGGVGGGASTLNCTCDNCTCTLCSKRKKGEAEGKDGGSDKLQCTCKDCTCPICSRMAGAKDTKEKEKKGGPCKCPPKVEKPPPPPPKPKIPARPPCKCKQDKDKPASNTLVCNCIDCSCPICPSKGDGGKKEVPASAGLECTCKNCECSVCKKKGDGGGKSGAAGGKCEDKPVKEPAKKTCECASCLCVSCASQGGKSAAGEPNVEDSEVSIHEISTPNETEIIMDELRVLKGMLSLFAPPMFLQQKHKFMDNMSMSPDIGCFNMSKSNVLSKEVIKIKKEIPTQITNSSNSWKKKSLMDYGMDNLNIFAQSETLTPMDKSKKDPQISRSAHCHTCLVSKPHGKVRTFKMREIQCYPEDFNMCPADTLIRIGSKLRKFQTQEDASVCTTQSNSTKQSSMQELLKEIPIEKLKPKIQKTIADKDETHSSRSKRLKSINVNLNDVPPFEIPKRFACPSIDCSCTICSARISNVTKPISILKSGSDWQRVYQSKSVRSQLSKQKSTAYDLIDKCQSIQSNEVNLSMSSLDITYKCLKQQGKAKDQLIKALGDLLEGLFVDLRSESASAGTTGSVPDYDPLKDFKLKVSCDASKRSVYSKSFNSHVSKNSEFSWNRSINCESRSSVSTDRGSTQSTSFKKMDCESFTSDTTKKDITISSNFDNQTISTMQLAVKQMEEKCKDQDVIIKAVTKELKQTGRMSAFYSFLKNIPSEMRRDLVETIHDDFGVTHSEKLVPSKVPVKDPSKESKTQIGDYHINLEGFEITNVTRITNDSLIVKWSIPNCKQICCYEIVVNDESYIKIPDITKSSMLINSLNLSKPVSIAVYVLTTQGRCEPPAKAIFELKTKYK